MFAFAIMNLVNILDENYTIYIQHKQKHYIWYTKKNKSPDLHLIVSGDLHISGILYDLQIALGT